MAQLTIPHTFSTGDTISAVQNNENNTAIVSTNHTCHNTEKKDHTKLNAIPHKFLA